MSKLYILSLIKNKFYIGKTSKSILERIDQHRSGKGSLWTRLYPPIEILEIKHNISPFDEDLYTKIYMHRHGIENVRGGSYVEKDLPNYQLWSLKREFETLEDRCFKCGGKGHFANQCSG